MEFNSVFTKKAYEAHQLWLRTEKKQGTRLDLKGAEELKKYGDYESYLKDMAFLKDQLVNQNNIINTLEDDKNWLYNRIELKDKEVADKDVEIDELKEIAEETIKLQGAGLALDYALAFLDSVNWYEIADNINEIFELVD